jgi:hypothetical protein
MIKKNPLTIAFGSGLFVPQNVNDVYTGGPPLPKGQHIAMLHIIID